MPFPSTNKRNAVELPAFGFLCFVMDTTHGITIAARPGDAAIALSWR